MGPCFPEKQRTGNGYSGGSNRDLRKAFDSIQHEAIWRSLSNHSVSEQYICLLNLYTDPRATVVSDVESDETGIARGTKLEILPPEGKLKSLGQMATVVDQETTEVPHRIRCAWPAFARHRQELASQSCSLRHRLHMFDAVVTPTITYGAGTKENEKMLRTAQRRKLRLIIQTDKNSKRRNLEEQTFGTTK